MQARTALILELVGKTKIRNQKELLDLLIENGVHTTQATLSRELSRLGITKQRNGKENFYVLPQAKTSGEAPYGSTTAANILSLEISGQACVIKTLPGCANMVGVLIDGHKLPGLMGTIAGDDTLLLILRNGAAAAVLTAALEELMPGIETVLK